MARGAFFGDELEGSRPAESAVYSTPRAMTASAQVIDLQKARTNPLKLTQAWQKAAWDYVDQIGELKYAFGLIANIVSRAMIYAAVTADVDAVPVEAGAFLDNIDSSGDEQISKAVDIAQATLKELSSHSELLRTASLNFGVAGECYLMNLTTWDIASVTELEPGTPPKYNKFKEAGKAVTLPAKTYIARMWRSHGRWSGEADSSMLGVLEQCEQLLLYGQVIRSISRSQLGAGVVYIPNGLVPASGRTIEEALADVTTEPVENEAAAGTVEPLFLTGPSELGAQLKRIDLARQVDENLVAAADKALDRMLAGLDIPKDIISGLAEVRYSNALVIDDNLYKAHIEPMLMLICDALTEAYLRPILRKAGVKEELVKQFVIWYNPSNIVTRPDRSQSANEGYDRYILSEEAWRSTRGYTEADKPSPEELIRRLALNKAVIPPDLASVLIESLYPDFFKQQRAEHQQSAGLPSDVTSLLNGASPDASPDPNAPPEPTSGPTEQPHQREAVQEKSGGDIQQGGSMPPRFV